MFDSQENQWLMACVDHDESCRICIFTMFSLVSADMSGFVCHSCSPQWKINYLIFKCSIKKVLINCSTGHEPISVSSSIRCCECSASLSHWYYEKDGRLFCKKDYWTKFGELCHGCNDPITTGLIMVRGSIRWVSSLITPLVLCLLIELQLGAVTRTYIQEGNEHTWVRTFTTNIRTCT